MSTSQKRIASLSDQKKPVLLDHILSTERETLIFRLLALGIAIATIYFWHEDVTEISAGPAVAVAVAYLVYTLWLGRVILPWMAPRLTMGLSLTYLVCGLVLVDSLALTAMWYIVGDPRSVALVLLPLFIIYHSIYLGYLSSLLSATFFSAFSVMFAYMWGEADFVDFLKSYVAVQVPFFYLLAVFGGHLAERRLRERLEKEELRHKVRHDGGGDEVLVAEDQEMIGGLHLGSILQEVVTACSQLTGLSKCLLALIDERSGSLVGAAGNIDPGQMNLASIDGLVFDFEEGSATAQALRTGQPAVVSDAVREEHKVPPWAPWFGAEVMLVIPLIAGGREWGAMYLFDTGAGRTIPAEKIYLAKRYAKVAAGAIAEARLGGSPA